jgi:predicted nucleic-acid-binding Zn-ribbon protein
MNIIIFAVIPCILACPNAKDAAWLDAENAMNCPYGTEYHCARKYKSEEFIGACAKVINCTAGTEPVLKLKNKTYVVRCQRCKDRNFYNDSTVASNMISRCPHYKTHHCTGNKKLCSDTLISDRYCRCQKSFKTHYKTPICFSESWIRCYKK